MQISKHLGGDMAHTHMVKGLDYKLLNRIRREQQLQEAETLETCVQCCEERLYKNAFDMKLSLRFQGFTTKCDDMFRWGLKCQSQKKRN